MAPYLLALLLLAQDAPGTEPDMMSDGPVATATLRGPAETPTPIEEAPASTPADDYGYVGWCYGALSGYVDLYDAAMPEVERIERAWPTPTTEENIKIIYPGQRAEARESLKLLRAAMQAAEKASPSSLIEEGQAAIKKGRAVWNGATSMNKAQMAQFWMSWSPPPRCEETATRLTERSNLFGQALSGNVVEAAPEPEVPLEPDTSEAAIADTVSDAPPSAIDELLAPETPTEAAVPEATNKNAGIKLRGRK